MISSAVNLVDYRAKDVVRSALKANFYRHEYENVT